MNRKQTLAAFMISTAVLIMVFTTGLFTLFPLEQSERTRRSTSGWWSQPETVQLACSSMQERGVIRVVRVIRASNVCFDNGNGYLLCKHKFEDSGLKVYKMESLFGQPRCEALALEGSCTLESVSQGVYQLSILVPKNNPNGYCVIERDEGGGTTRQVIKLAE